jgi:hypothetical protein
VSTTLVLAHPHITAMTINKEIERLKNFTALPS